MSIDEESRCRVHAAAAATLNVLANPLQVDLIVYLELEPRHVELESLGVHAKLIQLQMGLVLEQQVMHRPELPLRARRFCRLRGKQRMRMDFFEREMPEHEAQRVRKMGKQYLDCRHRLLAVRAFEVAVFDQGDTTSLSTQKMVGVVHLNGEFEGLGTVHFICSRIAPLPGGNLPLHVQFSLQAVEVAID